MQWGPIGQFLNKGPDNMSYTTVSFGSLYGPSGGNATSVHASKSASISKGMVNLNAAHLSLPVLFVFGVAVWWSLRQFD
jgi:hypothetical protein